MMRREEHSRAEQSSGEEEKKEEENSLTHQILILTQRADYSVVLANFGLAVMVPKYGPGFFGTLAYLAPEYHVNGDLLWDTPADVFALGTIMIELLNGVDPVRLINMLSIIK